MYRKHILLFSLAVILFPGIVSAQAATPVQYRLRQILIEPKISPERQKSIREQAEDCVKKARWGGDFTTLAKRLSQEPGASQTGGDLGFFEHKQMVKPFSDAVFSMKTGDISEVVTTQFGYHIIKLHAIDSDKRHAQHILFMLSPGREDSLKALKTLADVRKQLMGGGDFNEMLKKHTNEKLILETEGYMVWQQPDMMLPSFLSAVKGLRKGEISEPFTSVIGMHIVLVDSLNYNANKLLSGFPARIEKKLNNKASQ